MVKQLKESSVKWVIRAKVEEVKPKHKLVNLEKSKPGTYRAIGLGRVTKLTNKTASSITLDQFEINEVKSLDNLCVIPDALKLSAAYNLEPEDVIFNIGVYVKNQDNKVYHILSYDICGVGNTL